MTITGVPQPVVIDTDGGVDDAVALWWALTNPALDVRAITVVWGNVSVEIAAQSVLRVVHATGRSDVPVAVGARGPIDPAPDLRPADFIHGRDGLGDTERPPPPLEPVDESAMGLMTRTVRAQPGEVAIVTVGPLSNLAAAVRADPELARDAAGLTVMGGSARGSGNALPAGEANVAHDPGAAQTVVTADWREPPLLVGLDVTLPAGLTDAEFALLAQHRNDAAAFLDEPLRFYRKFGSTLSAPLCPCHDLLAVMAVAEPDVITDAPVLPLAVDCGRDAAWGATVVDFRAPKFAALDGSTQESPPGFAPWRIALGVDVEHFRTRVRTLFGA